MLCDVIKLSLVFFARNKCQAILDHNMTISTSAIQAIIKDKLRSLDKNGLMEVMVKTVGMTFTIPVHSDQMSVLSHNDGKYLLNYRKLPWRGREPLQVA